MTPLGLHAPARSDPDEQIVCTENCSPLISIFFSLPLPMNPMKRPSGDQNGSRASSVPGNL
jgi:hypothetical protein